MSKLATRFSVFTLGMALFALALSALVTSNDRQATRVHFGTAAPCFHPATPGCVAFL